MVRARRRRSEGLVLVAVLWIVAAVTVVVVGMVRSVRQEMRMLSSARALAVAGGVGDAAIHLALRDLAAQGAPPARLAMSQVAYGQATVPVRVMPLNGLIDLNAAGAPLLASLYEVAGGRARGEAEALAQRTVAFRTPASGLLPERFDAPEDLLRVPGVDFDLYDRLARLVTVDVEAEEGGGVDPMAAPVEVLEVLAGGRPGIAPRIAAARDAGEANIDTTDLQAGFLAAGTVQRYGVEARVPLPDGAWLHVVRRVALGDAAQDRLPWQTFRTERWVEPAPR
jgi:general secretion pathway protein K